MIYYYENIDENWYKSRNVAVPYCFVLTKGSQITLMVEKELHNDKIRPILIINDKGKEIYVRFKNERSIMDCLHDLNDIISRDDGHPEMSI